MVPGIADVMPRIVQIRSRFEQTPEVSGQPVCVLKPQEQIVREPRHFAGMAQWDAIVFGHLLHHAALIDGELRQAAIEAARGEIGDNAVAHTRGRIKQRGHAEGFENVQQHGGTRER